MAPVRDMLIFKMTRFRQRYSAKPKFGPIESICRSNMDMNILILENNPIFEMLYLSNAA